MLIVHGRILLFFTTLSAKQYFNDVIICNTLTNDNSGNGQIFGHLYPCHINISVKKPKACKDENATVMKEHNTLINVELIHMQNW